MAKTWFISIPSQTSETAPAFVGAIQTFAQSQHQIKIILPKHDYEDIQDTKQDIAAADIVIAEVSSPSTGSGIELGWASAAGKKIVAFHQGSAAPSPVIQFVTTEIHTYITEEHILEVLAELVK